MWFTKKNEKNDDDDFKSYADSLSEIELLWDRIGQLRSDLDDLKKIHGNLANEFLVYRAIVDTLRTVGTEAKTFIEQFREMILVGNRLMGYEGDTNPPINKMKRPLTKKTKKKSNG